MASPRLSLSFSTLLFGKNPLFTERLVLLGNTGTTSRRWTRGSPAQSQGKPQKGRNYQLQVSPGREVRERDIVATQKGLKYHPGLNAGLDPRDNSIYAITDGTLVVTSEKFTPETSHQMVDKYYADMKGNVYKRYVNVIPKKSPLLFKLIDLV